MSSHAHHTGHDDAPGSDAVREALDNARPVGGRSLLERSRERPMLLIFLRHFG